MRKSEGGQKTYGLRDLGTRHGAWEEQRAREECEAERAKLKAQYEAAQPQPKDLTLLERQVDEIMKKW